MMKMIAFPLAAPITGLALALAPAACGNENGEGGEAGTPARNVPEAEPEGVGGTSNQ